MAARTKRIIQENLNKTDNSEMEVLRKQIKELEELIKLNIVSSKDTALSVSNKEVREEVDEKINISSDDYIKVMSLCPHELNLTTQARGKGKVFSFKRMFEVKRILYRDLVDIMENHSAFTEQGLFFILDKDVIRKHGLDEVYEKLLDKEKIEKVLKGNQTDAVNMFKVANSRQQNTISQMIIDDIVSEKEVDLNFVDRISRIMGFNLQEKAENIKKLINNKKEE